MKTLEVQKKSKNYKLEHFKDADTRIKGCLSSIYADLSFEETSDDCFALRMHNYGLFTNQTAIKEITYLTNNVSNEPKSETTTSSYLQIFQKAVRLQMKHDEESTTEQEPKKQQEVSTENKEQEQVEPAETTTKKPHLRHGGVRPRKALSLEDQILDVVHQSIENEETEELLVDVLKKKLDAWGIVPNQTELIIKQADKKPKNVGKQHKQFGEIFQCLKAGVNVALVGPAGSGKTTAVKECAKALELEFYSKSVSAQTGSHEFFGYQDANGNYVRTIFRDAFENGGVFLLDEFDAGNPNVLAALNQATANGECAFADGMVTKHDDFIVVMAGNTFGHGANSDYVGRNKIDAATLDRFVFIHFGYDEDFETQLSTNKDWAKKIQTLRKIANDKKIKTIISPRATLNGEKLLQVGMSEKQVLQLTVFKGLHEDEIKMLKNGLKEGVND